MKELNITFKFTVPDDCANPYGAAELADYAIDCIWDAMYEMKYDLKRCEISVDDTVEYSHDYDLGMMEDNDNNITS